MVIGRPGRPGAVSSFSHSREKFWLKQTIRIVLGRLYERVGGCEGVSEMWVGKGKFVKECLWVSGRGCGSG